MRLFVALALLTCTLATAQDPAAPAPSASPQVVDAAPAQAEQRPSAGVGIGIVPLDAGGLGPTIEFYLPFSAGEFRAEPSFGVFTSAQGPDGVDSSVVTFGLGCFYATRVAAPTDVYVGARAKLHVLSVDSDTSKDSENAFAFAAVLGGEHYLGTHFSVGAEGQIGTYQNSRLNGVVGLKDKGIFTTGVAFLRFYYR